MAGEDQRVIDLQQTYLHLDNAGGAVPIQVTPAFWQDLMSGKTRYEGRLVIAGDLAEDMNQWEMHPAGEELLLCHSGRFEVLLETPAGEERFALGPGEAFVVPRGAWHRVLVREPGRLLFVTWGEGTRHRPL